MVVCRLYVALHIPAGIGYIQEFVWFLSSDDFEFSVERPLFRSQPWARLAAAGSKV